MQTNRLQFLPTKWLYAPLAFLFFSVQPIHVKAQTSLKKLWATDTLLQTAESVLPEPGGDFLWVSCIEGAPSGKDGKGSIAQVEKTGKIRTLNWLKGLNAPKGMARFGNTLYVSDIDALVLIDVPSKTILQRIAVEGAKFLNDVAVDKKGMVYVSDMGTGKIHRFSDGKPEVWIEGLTSPNGVYCDGKEVFMLCNGSLLKAGEDKKTTIVAEGMDPSTDGIGRLKNEDFLVTCWMGAVYRISGSAKPELILDTRPQQSKTADLGLDPEKGILYIPTFFGNQVVAYQLSDFK
jgi:hypothetical protein